VAIGKQARAPTRRWQTSESELANMTDKKDKQPSQSDEELEREVRKGREFSLTEAIGRMAGPGAMKGASPVPRKEQAAAEIENWLGEHISAANAELQTVLLRRIDESEMLLHNYEQPLSVLASWCRKILASDYLLKEVVRETDVEWGRVNGEKPYFDEEGVPPHPDDPYTFQSVHKALAQLIEQLDCNEPRVDA
jgi:hypothetical protein